MHPGPMIRGLEITSDVADGPQSVIEQQVRNGVAIRMALIHRALAFEEPAKPKKPVPPPTPPRKRSRS
jgi:aspartate carbamoyltransferase catalytic subunit